MFKRFSYACVTRLYASQHIFIRLALFQMYIFKYIARIYITIHRDMLLSIDARTVHRTWKVGRRWPTYIIQTAALYTAIESTSSVVLTKFRRCKLPTTALPFVETLIASPESSEQTPLSKSALKLRSLLALDKKKRVAFDSAFNLLP